MESESVGSDITHKGGNDPVYADNNQYVGWNQCKKDYPQTFIELLG